MTWSPSLYSRFEDDRTRPVRDLVAAIPAPNPARAIDLGCGPGNSTEVLATRFPTATITGLDSSPEMIAAAQTRLPHLSFETADIATWRAAATYDVILSNAVLQWLPDHATLFPRLASQLADGGSLAIQMPLNLDEPAYRLMHDLAAAPEWRRPPRGNRRQTRRDGHPRLVLQAAQTPLPPGRHVAHPLLPRPVRPRRDRRLVPGQRPAPLPRRPRRPASRNAFLAQYRAGIASAYPPQPDGTSLLPFPRLFLVATR